MSVEATFDVARALLILCVSSGDPSNKKSFCPPLITISKENPVKLRHSLRFLALGLLFGAFNAGAMPTEPQDAPPAVAKAADFVVSTPAGGCDTKASTADAKLQIALAPNLAWMSSQGFSGKCGGCGDSVCNGQNVGAICAFDGVFWYACINLYGNRCGPSGQECFCTTSGPL